MACTCGSEPGSRKHLGSPSSFTSRSYQKRKKIYSICILFLGYNKLHIRMYIFSLPLLFNWEILAKNELEKQTHMCRHPHTHTHAHTHTGSYGQNQLKLLYDCRGWCYSWLYCCPVFQGAKSWCWSFSQNKQLMELFLIASSGWGKPKCFVCIGCQIEICKLKHCKKTMIKILRIQVHKRIWQPISA